MRWPTQSPETYALVRWDSETGELERILFNVGIIGKMQVTENEWKPVGDLVATLKPTK